MIVQVNGKVRGKIEVESDTSKEEMEKLAFSLENVKNYTDNKEVVKVVTIPKKLVNIVVK
jgi:leucyl-tRNA synthetase